MTSHSSNAVVNIVVNNLVEILSGLSNPRDGIVLLMVRVVIDFALDIAFSDGLKV